MLTYRLVVITQDYKLPEQPTIIPAGTRMFLTPQGRIEYVSFMPTGDYRLKSLPLHNPPATCYRVLADLPAALVVSHMDNDNDGQLIGWFASFYDGGE